MSVLEPFVVARLLGQVGEQGSPVGVGVQMADPAPLAVIPQQHLGHGQGEQFAVGELGEATSPGPGRDHVVVEQNVKFGQEGVQFFRHKKILGTLHPRSA